ncbi:hypothetical protein [Oryzomonas rubra]|uniref:Uncharacterized protein n=1 Tax=Oryzomonas rubra TaxID=2509454 RepID=A0A5A9X7K4_9BACT|nr:hypothetical protein [Oryzomonas rubra]KAA0888774.1 hypothetical protein ET418_15450 [Oryzomonas rubra]
MKPYFQTYSPRCRVLIYDLLAGGQAQADLSNDILSIATNKAYGRAAGTWQIMLPYKQVKSWKSKDGGAMKYYHEILEPDDMITIELDAGDGKGMQPVMLGLVDRPSLVRQGDVHPVRQVKVSGQDVGKLLAKHDIGWDISAAQIQKSNQSLGRAAFVDQTDDGKQGVKDYIKSYMARVVLQTGTAASQFEQLALLFLNQLNNRVVKNMDFKTDTDDTWMVWDPSIMFIKNTTVWDAMSRLSHRPYNMLNADTSVSDVGKFEVILERNPITTFGETDRSQAGVDLHLVDDTEIINDDLGVSDAERINLLCYWPTLYKYAVSECIDIVMSNSELTKFDADSIALHGYCSKIIDDVFVPVNVTDPMSDSAANQKIAWAPSQERATLFWNWYQENHTYESGTILTHLRPEIRAGHCLVVRQGNTSNFKEYLVEQVSHQYNVNPMPQFTTAYQVTRGQDAAEIKKSNLTTGGIMQ